MTKPSAPEADAAWLRAFRRRLTTWYDRHARPLPWRQTRDPYRIWVSEIMLQQTTVAAVIPYYQRFLAAFPTVADLAAAEEAAVLRQWEGLGYYSRARNLHTTAKRLAAEGFPATTAGWAALPGVGRYTAGAVASFAFDQPAPIVEANTLRLYARLIGYAADPRAAAGQKRLWEFAGHIVPKTRAGRFNQAVMELGGTICTVSAPACGVCPVRANCAAFAAGTQDRIPLAKAKLILTDVTEAAIAARDATGAVLLRRRMTGERWAGLWDFPRCELTAADLAGWEPYLDRSGRASLPLADPPPMALSDRLARAVADQTGVTVRVGLPFAELRHAVTRYRIRLLAFAAEVSDGGPRDAEVRLVPPAELPGVPLSRSGRRLADRLVGVRGIAPG